jgi:hypothetical protein
MGFTLGNFTSTVYHTLLDFTRLAHIFSSTTPNGKQVRSSRLDDVVLNSSSEERRETGQINGSSTETECQNSSQVRNSSLSLLEQSTSDTLGICAVLSS